MGSQGRVQRAQLRGPSGEDRQGVPVDDQRTAAGQGSLELAVAIPAEARTDQHAADAPVIEDMATKPAKPVKRYTAPVPSRQAVQQTAAESASTAKSILKVDPAAPKPEDDPMLPSELRSFGWNAQP